MVSGKTVKSGKPVRADREGRCRKEREVYCLVRFLIVFINSIMARGSDPDLLISIFASFMKNPRESGSFFN